MNDKASTPHEKFNLKSAIGDARRLPEQLVHPLFTSCAIALIIHVYAVRIPRRVSIDEHPKSDGSSMRGRPHHKMKIVSVKAVGDATTGLNQSDRFSPHAPIASQSVGLGKQRAAPLPQRLE